jgi:hypothetical protein
MIYLGAAVAVLGVLSVFHLVLTMGVIRRLRAQDALLARLKGQDTGSPTVAVGGRIGAFDVTAADGSQVGRAGSGLRLTGFFSPDCQACSEQLPQFVDFAVGFRGDIVAVIVTDDVAQSASYHEKLAGVARTVVEPTGGAVVAAFGVTSFPAMTVTDAEGLVVSTGNAVEDLAVHRQPVAVR